MANNPALYNAIINGITSGSQNRWTIPADGGGNYTIFRTIVITIATRVDEAIPPTILNYSQVGLMESICLGYFQNTSIETVRHALPEIVDYILNTYTSINAILEPIDMTGPQGPTGPAGPAGPAGAQGPPGTSGFTATDTTFDLVSGQLRRAAISGVITIPSGSNESQLRAIPATEDAVVSGGIPFIIHRSLNMSGSAGSTSVILQSGVSGAFPLGMPFNARLIDAWALISSFASGSSIQVFRQNTSSGNELTSILSTAAAGTVRNSDTNLVWRNVLQGDSIIVRKNNGALATVGFRIFLSFLRGE